MRNSPCIVDGVPCDKRHVGCHGQCKAYQDFAAGRARMNEEKLRQQVYTTYICDLVAKNKSRR